MRWHAKLRCEKFLKNNNLIVVQLQNSFLPRLTSGTLSEIPWIFQLPNVPHANQRHPEVVAPHKLGRVHGILSYNYGNIAGILPRGGIRRRASRWSLRQKGLRHVTNDVNNRRTLTLHCSNQLDVELKTSSQQWRWNHENRSQCSKQMRGKN
jgi:hypothetical protein